MREKLSPEQREIAIKWKKEIDKGIGEKQKIAEVLRQKIEKLKFKIDMCWPIKDLIKNEMSERKESIHSKRLNQCLNKVDEEKNNLEKQLEKITEERSNLETELIINRRKLGILKKDLEEESG